MDDTHLLDEYARTRSEAAFAELVRRHVDLVYAACFRRLRDATAADDATQVVFVTLARRAGLIRPGTVVAGWLYQAAVFHASRAARAAAIRRRHEMAAADQKPKPGGSSRETPVWMGRDVDVGIDGGFEDSVDGALRRLRSPEREAIILRYLQGRTLAEVAGEMRTTEEAARKRVARGLDRLRQLLRPAGATPTTFGVAAVERALSAALYTAPASVRVSVAKAAAAGFVGTKGAAATAGKGGVGLKGLAWHMAMTKAKSLLAGAVVATVVGTGVAGVRSLGHGSDEVVSVAATAKPTGMARHVDPVWRSQFDDAYHLKPGEMVRFVPGPPIAARQAFDGDERRFGRGEPTAPDNVLLLDYDPASDTVKTTYATVGYPYSLAEVLGSGLHVSEWKLVAESIPMSLVMHGDWVCHKGASDQEVFDGLAAVLSHRLGRPLRFQPRQVTRDELVFSGHYRYAPRAGQPSDGVIRFAAGGLTHVRHRFPLTDLLTQLSCRGELPMVNETDDPGMVVDAADYFRWGGLTDHEAVDMLTRQTGLRCARQPRTTTVWTLLTADGQPFPQNEQLK